MINKDALLNAALNTMAEKLKEEEFAHKPILTLGEFILLLKNAPPTNNICLDFNNLNPTKLDSYRGYYSDLALGYEIDSKQITVAQLLRECEGAIGRVYYGYKGGEFLMTRRTLVWVAPYSMCGRMLIGIKNKNGITTILTKEDEE